MRNGNYATYRSMNGSWLQLIPDDRGNLCCRDNTVAIEGLDGFIAG